MRPEEKGGKTISSIEDEKRIRLNKREEKKDHTKSEDYEKERKDMNKGEMSW